MVDAVILHPDEKPVRVEQLIEKGVVFKLSRQPRESKAKGVLMFFPHPTSGHKGIVCAMAKEPIPGQATFPKPVSSVSVALWGPLGRLPCSKPSIPKGTSSTGSSSNLSRAAKPQATQSPFNMAVSAKRIADIQFSGPGEGEYLAADEVRYTPMEDDVQK